MKAFNKLVTLGVLAAAIVLSGCGKTSNSGSSGTTASTPPKSNTTTCTVQTDGTVRNSAGTVCTSGTFVCPASGKYVNSNNQQVNCTPGSTVNINNGYPYPDNPTNYTNGCAYWSQYYNTLYVPMILNNQYVCVNYEWLNQYSYGSSYWDNYNYYYQYPPYSSNGGHSCGDTSVWLSYGNFSGEVCF